MTIVTNIEKKSKCGIANTYAFSCMYILSIEEGGRERRRRQREGERRISEEVNSQARN